MCPRVELAVNGVLGIKPKVGLVYQVEFKCTGVYTGCPVAPHPVGVVDSVCINGTAEFVVDIGAVSAVLPCPQAE